MFVHELLYVVVIPVDVRHALVQPAFTARVGGPSGDYPHRRDDVATAVGLQSSHIVCIVGVEIRAPHRRQVERLAGRFEGDAVVHDRFVRKTGKRRVLVSTWDEITMNLVGEDDNTMPQADLAEPHQIRR